MREIRTYGSVGVSAGNRRHYPARQGRDQGARVCDPQQQG